MNEFIEIYGERFYRTYFTNKKGYYYRKDIGSPKDPQLGGIIVSAVTSNENGSIKNRIHFTRHLRSGKKIKAKIHCIHSVIYEGTLDEFETIEPSDLKPRNLTLTIENHFFALASFVEGLLKYHLLDLLKLSYTSEETNPETLKYGLNHIFQMQLIRVFTELRVDITSLIREILLYLAENVDHSWLKTRFFFLNDIYNLEKVMARDIETLQAIIDIWGVREVRNFCISDGQFPILKYLISLETPQLHIEDNLDILDYFVSEERTIKDRISLSKRPNLPYYILKALSKDPYSTVRRALARRGKGLSKSLLRKLANDKSIFVRSNLAEYNRLPPELVESLAKDENITVRLAIARHCNTPISMRIFNILIADVSKSVRIALATNPLLTKYQIGRLIRTGDPDIIFKTVQWNEDLPEKIVRELLTNQNDINLKNVILNNNKIPVELLDFIIENETSQNLLLKNVILAGDDQLTLPQLIKIVKKMQTNDDDEQLIIMYINWTLDDWTSNEIYTLPQLEPVIRMLIEKSWLAKKQILQDANLPEKIVREVLDNRDVEGRIYLAENTRLRKETIQTLISDPSYRVRLRIARNTSLRKFSEMSSILARDPSSRVRNAFNQNMKLGGFTVGDIQRS
jgi:hypothetical protein